MIFDKQRKEMTRCLGYAGTLKQYKNKLSADSDTGMRPFLPAAKTIITLRLKNNRFLFNTDCTLDEGMKGIICQALVSQILSLIKMNQRRINAESSSCINHYASANKPLVLFWYGLKARGQARFI